MRRTFGLSLLTMAIAFGLTALANEKPTTEFQNIMKSNAATNGAMGLRAHIAAKDYDAIAKDAATFKDNFSKIEAFWTQKKVDDAVKLAKTGHEAAEDLEKAAKAKDDAAIMAAQMKIGGTCGGCHMAHREQLPDKTFEIK
jgi:mono/diheme cytochrome c family protein